jgi:pterin-4a-carbinolamine dehydratase
MTLKGMDFLNKVAAIAEQENHHPDIHLTGYQKN